MGCKCGNKTRYEVVSAAGKVVFGPTPAKHIAQRVTERYPGSRVRELEPKAPAPKKRTSTSKQATAQRRAPR